MLSQKAKTLSHMAFLASVLSLSAQESRFQITTFSDLGGDVSIGDRFTVSGGIAPIAPGLPDNGPLAVAGGIWNLLPELGPEEKALLSAVFSNGSVIVSWPKSRVTWIL